MMLHSAPTDTYGSLSGSQHLPAAVLLRAFEQSHEGIVITDHNNLIIAANGAFSRLTGYPPNELLGKDPRILASGRAAPEFYAAMWEALDSKNYWEGEIWNKHHDGSSHPSWLKIAVLRDQNGTIQNYVANFTDIHANHEAADRLAYLAYHDPLTNLPNRLAFESQLGQALRICERENH